MATTVRRAPSGGLNVRSTAAGTKVATLNEGDLMYDIAGVAAVTKPLNGTSYVWIKVHYYKSTGNTTVEGEGWVTKSNAAAISTKAPAKSDTYSSNADLKQYQMLVNARYIYKYLLDSGWTSNAIFAVLGNMEVESTINPGLWENHDTTNSKLGYGLTQWTPSTKLTDWLGKKEKSDIDNQLSRLVYEANNGEQWTSSYHSPALTFSEFIASTKTCSTLAEYFVRCYENPKNVDSKVLDRQTNAKKWSTLIGYLA